MMARPFVPTAHANAAPISFRCELIRRSSLSCYANMPITPNPLVLFFFFSHSRHQCHTCLLAVGWTLRNCGSLVSRRLLFIKNGVLACCWLLCYALASPPSPPHPLSSSRSWNIYSIKATCCTARRHEIGTQGTFCSIVMNATQPSCQYVIACGLRASTVPASVSVHTT